MQTAENFQENLPFQIELSLQSLEFTDVTLHDLRVMTSFDYFKNYSMSSYTDSGQVEQYFTTDCNSHRLCCNIATKEKVTVCLS